jgi:hypothetical protein
MPVKFNQYWTINEAKNGDYAKFVIKNFIPGMNRLGVHAVAGWSVLVGGYSEIILEGVSSDLSLLENALQHPDYKQLKDDLLEHVKSYKTKVLVSHDHNNAYTPEIKDKTVKFNQTWDVISSRKAAYNRFIADEFNPCLESLGIQVAGEWEVLIGDGPRTICEGRAQDISELIHNLQSDRFKHTKRALKKYVENYESRLLSFHIQKIKGYKSASYVLIAE